MAFGGLLAWVENVQTALIKCGKKYFSTGTKLTVFNVNRSGKVVQEPSLGWAEAELAKRVNAAKMYECIVSWMMMVRIAVMQRMKREERLFAAPFLINQPVLLDPRAEWSS